VRYLPARQPAPQHRPARRLAISLAWSCCPILPLLLATAAAARADDAPSSPAAEAGTGGAATDKTAALALEIILNGRPTGKVGAFIWRGGKLFATRSELHDLGFAVPDDADGGVDPIAVSAVPGLKIALDMQTQVLTVAAEDGALLAGVYGSAATMHLEPLITPGYGAVVSYDAVVTRSGGILSGGSLIDARIFSPFGVLESTGIARFTPAPGERAAARLDTTFTFTQERALRRWRVGDVISGALDWTRAVRLGGVQVARDFSLRPDIVTYPYPSISASAALPSSVELFVNGLRQSTETVPQGPFVIRTLPLVNGAGEVTATATDALGRQTTTTLPLYVSSQLLKPGLASYSVEAGSVRQLYGTAGDRYSGWAGSGTLRYGVTDWMTIDSHAELAAGLELAGVGVELRVFALGTLTAAIAGSSGRGKPPFGLITGTPATPASGALVSLAIQRQSRRFNFGLSGRFATAGYRDIAAVNGAPVPRSTISANVGFSLANLGNIGLSWIEQRGGRQAVASAPPSPGLTPDNFVPGPVHFSVATATYNVPLTERLKFYATAYRDLTSRATGGQLGLTFYLGHRMTASASGSLQGGALAGDAEIARTAFERNDWGFRLRDSEGSQPERDGLVEYLSPYGYVSASVSQTPGSLAERAEWRGSVAYAGGELLMGDLISDSFAVVKAGAIAGVPVLSENRLYGTTNKHGVLLVPNLRSYENNTLAIDQTALPPDIEVDRSRAIVRPADRSGVVVDFGIRRINAALLTLHDKDGKAIPVGSTAQAEGGAQQPVGFDGLAYLTGLTPHSRIEVELPDGHRCAVQFDYHATPGEVPSIGPFTCN